MVANAIHAELSSFYHERNIYSVNIHHFRMNHGLSWAIYPRYRVTFHPGNQSGHKSRGHFYLGAKGPCVLNPDNPPIASGGLYWTRVTWLADINCFGQNRWAVVSPGVNLAKGALLHNKVGLWICLIQIHVPHCIARLEIWADVSPKAHL